MAFPSSLSSDVAEVERRLPMPSHLHSETIGDVWIEGEAVHIPYRVYVDEPGLHGSLSALQRNILACVFSRHHDGFVRQRYLDALLNIGQPWSVPFVVQLLGEYVLEIAEHIDRHTGQASHAKYIRFANQNPTFIRRVTQRATSYWNCYFRTQFPKLHDYPAVRLLRAMQGDV